MRKLLLCFTLIIVCACTENNKRTQDSEVELDQSSNIEIDLKTTSTDASSSNDANTQLNDLFKIGNDLLESSGSKKNDLGQLDTSSLLDLLEASGVSREELEKLMKNPDSLKILAQQAIKNRDVKKEESIGDITQGKFSNGQLSSKTTSTGVSLEEAILLVQAESGIEATIEKLKQVDSLAGTNTMEQLDLEVAQQVFNSVERKNDENASSGEEKKIELLKRRSRNMHNDKEAVTLLADLEKIEKDIAAGDPKKINSKYHRAIINTRKKVKIYKKDFARKAKAAKKKFQQLNPDLYFGEEAGNTYIGSGRKIAVYLPLGKLAFADKVIDVNHPKLLINDHKNVIGEPDVIDGFDVEDLSGIYSLGLGGDLTVQFVDNALTDVNGPDLYIFEYGAIEPTNLEISKDGKNWIKVGKIDGGVAEVDIAKFVKPGELYYYVRLEDRKGNSSLPGADVDAIAAIGAAMRLNLDSKVLFETGKSELKPEGIEALRKLAESISVLKKGNVIVEGHTDDVGSASSNQKLSLARAKSVSMQLKKLIPSKSFKWREKGLGESKPLVENDSDKNRAKNRRVEVLVLPN